MQATTNANPVTSMFHFSFGFEESVQLVNRNEDVAD
jgi:hypothetical protein